MVQYHVQVQLKKPEMKVENLEDKKEAFVIYVKTLTGKTLKVTDIDSSTTIDRVKVRDGKEKRSFA